MADSSHFLEFPNSMKLAVIEALKADTFPNPKVGAILLNKNNKVKAIGHHKGKGTNHAEIEIINNTSIESTDTLYVTLEPCFHTDSSPSCADELLKTEIQNIVIGDVDSDKRTCGKSIEKLKNNGLNVTLIEGVNNFVNPNYNKKNYGDNSITYIGKIATSNNNKIYDYSDSSKYITNSESLDFTHLLRSTVDAILIGKNTLITDNPQLNVRISPLSHVDIKKYVLWGSDKTFITELAKIHFDKIFLTTFDDESIIKQKNVINLSNLSFNNLNSYMIDQNIKSLLVEGGNYVHKFFISSEIYDYFYKFVSQDSIANGLTLDNLISEYLMTDMNHIKKIQLKDNSLDIYN